MVPLLDPNNGKLVAVLGMDIDAHSWKWEVAAKIALPIVLAVMLGLLVSIVVLAHARRQILVNQEALRKSEEKHSKLNADLELRTRDLIDAQEELVRKEKLAILGQLSGSLGHELRNPLGVMINAVYFLRMDLSDADESTKEYLDILKEEIDSSLHIITDLLDFARIRIPRMVVTMPEELVRQCLERCAIPENVTLSVDIPETLPYLNVDPLQTKQVLTNFITNAVQAMPDDGALRVAARFVGAIHELPLPNQKQETDDFIAISVTDTGKGISPEHMKKLFQPLFTTKAKGIGLGLVVCKNLAEVNGGRIEVESALGKGTTFTVLLPIEGGNHERKAEGSGGGR